MAIQKSSKSNRPGWTVAEIQAKLGNQYSASEIESALSNFGSVSSDEELQTFMTLLPKPTQTYQPTPDDRGSGRNVEPAIDPSQAVREAHKSVNGSVVTGMEEIRRKSQDKFLQRVNPLIEQISDVVAEQQANAFFAACHQLVQSASDYQSWTGDTLGKYQALPGDTSWLTLDAKALPSGNG